MSELQIEDFRDSLQIDRDGLDDALINQPDLYFKVAEEYARAVSRRDEYYEGIKRVEAELNTEIRQELEDEGKKTTEAQISALVRSDKRYREAIRNHLDAREEAERWGALKESFGQRNYMLRELVQLYIAGYFATTTAKATQQDAAEAKYSDKRRRLASKRRYQRKQITGE